MASHQAKVIGILPFDDGLAKTRSRLAATVPICDPMPTFEHAQKVEVLQTGQVRRERDIGQSVVVAGEPSLPGERLLHLIE